MRSHFGTLGVPEKLLLEKSYLESCYHCLSLLYHPDRQVGKSESIPFSDINNAYRILRDPWERAKHFLELRQYQSRKSEVPLELQELLFSLQDEHSPEELNRLRLEVSSRLAKNQKNFEEICREIDQSSDNPELWNRLNEILVLRNYLLSLSAKLI